MTEHHNTLLINGKGQAKEGDGHDVFAAVPYELLNRIRISEVKVEQNQVVVRGDATAAYEPELGLKKFVREFVYNFAGFTISDEVETTKPAVLTFLLHADKSIEKENATRFSIKAGKVKLIIDPSIEQPNELPPTKQIQNGVQATIETNTLTAPGPPGAVDKGERQARGEKLLLSTPANTTRTRFVLRLKIM
jgi:hypothetical protein